VSELHERLEELSRRGHRSGPTQFVERIATRLGDDAMPASTRPRWAIAAAVGLVAVLIAGAVGVVMLRSNASNPDSPGPAVTSTSRPVSRSPVGSLLIGTENGSLALLSPTTGALQRTIPVAPAQAVPPRDAGANMGAVSAISVTADGQTAYLQRDVQRVGADRQIIERLSLDGGPPTFVAEGTEPAISPDGSSLAYLKPVPVNNWTRTVVVTDTRTGATTSWEMPYPPDSGRVPTPAGVNPAAELPEALSISWAPDGIHLAVAMTANAFNSQVGLELLDTSRPVEANNPRFFTSAAAIPHSTATQWFAAAYRGNTGQLGIIASCAQAQHCVSAATRLLSVDPGTGRVRSLGALTGYPEADTTTFDASGRTMYYVAQHITCDACQGPAADALYRWSAGSITLLRHGSEPGDAAASAVAWLP
jgi:hypothetical protein